MVSSHYKKRLASGRYFFPQIVREETEAYFISVNAETTLYEL